MTKNRMMTTMALMLATGAGAGGVLVGCASGDAGSGVQREVPLEQRHSLEVVQLRAGDLRPGMSTAEVFLQLGSPAEYRGDTWIYRGGDQTLTVRFRDDRYVGHEMR